MSNYILSPKSDLIFKMIFADYRNIDVTDKTELFNWMTFLKSEKKEEFEVISGVNPNIKKAYGVLKELSQDERTRLLFEEHEKAKKDELARIKGALDKGRAEGKSETAINLLKDGFSSESTARYTGLSIDEINELRKNLN